MHGRGKQNHLFHLLSLHAVLCATLPVTLCFAALMHASVFGRLCSTISCTLNTQLEHQPILKLTKMHAHLLPLPKQTRSHLLPCGYGSFGSLSADLAADALCSGVHACCCIHHSVPQESLSLRCIGLSRPKHASTAACGHNTWPEQSTDMRVKAAQMCNNCSVWKRRGRTAQCLAEGTGLSLGAVVQGRTCEVGTGVASAARHCGGRSNH